MKRILMLKTVGERGEGRGFKVGDNEADALVKDGSAKLLPEPKEKPHAKVLGESANASRGK